MLDLDSNPSVDVDAVVVVVVVVEAANHAKLDVDAILFLVDVGFDGFVAGLATLDLVDVVVSFVVVVLFLCDVVMQLSNAMLDVVVLLGWLSMVLVDAAG